MKTLYLVVMVFMLAACSPKIVQPLPPAESALKSVYRKTVEVIIVDVVLDSSKSKHRGKKEALTIVESTSTGERFEIWGSYGRRGDRFKISY